MIFVLVLAHVCPVFRKCWLHEICPPAYLTALCILTCPYEYELVFSSRWITALVGRSRRAC